MLPQPLLIRPHPTSALSQAAHFGDLFVGLTPSKRGLYYRQLWTAAEQQVGSWLCVNWVERGLASGSHAALLRPTPLPSNALLDALHMRTPGEAPFHPSCTGRQQGAAPGHAGAAAQASRDGSQQHGVGCRVGPLRGRRGGTASSGRLHMFSTPVFVQCVLCCMPLRCTANLHETEAGCSGVASGQVAVGCRQQQQPALEALRLWIHQPCTLHPPPASAPRFRLCEIATGPGVRLDASLCLLSR